VDPGNDTEENPGSDIEVGQKRKGVVWVLVLAGMRARREPGRVSTACRDTSLSFTFGVLINHWGLHSIREGEICDKR
jgi:hypothetical protein